MPKDKKKQRNTVLRALSLSSQTGIVIVACVVIGVFLGKFLDELLGSSPWLLLIFSFLGMAAAFKSIFNISRKK